MSGCRKARESRDTGAEPEFWFCTCYMILVKITCLPGSEFPDLYGIVRLFGVLSPMVGILQVLRLFAERGSELLGCSGTAH